VNSSAGNWYCSLNSMLWRYQAMSA
jgi:hypothetical protein